MNSTNQGLLAAIFVGICFLTGLLVGLIVKDDPIPSCESCNAPGFELVEFRVQEQGTGDWFRWRIENGKPVELGWD